MSFSRFNVRTRVLCPAQTLAVLILPYLARALPSLPAQQAPGAWIGQQPAPQTVAEEPEESNGGSNRSFCGTGLLCGWWFLPGITILLAIVILCHLSRNARVKRAEAEARAEKEADFDDSFGREYDEVELDQKPWWSGRSSRRDLELMECKQTGKLEA